MTFSIVAKDGTSIGFAAATAVPGGAGRIASIVPGKGCIAAQALANLFWRPYGTMLLQQRAGAAGIVRTLVPPDPRKQERQLLVMGADGRFDAFTGQACQPWAGQLVGADFAAAGNLLAGPRVIAEMARIWQLYRGAPLVERLMAALMAGEAAGGDRRGKASSAALQVADAHSIVVDGKIDGSTTPLLDLSRLVSTPAGPGPGLLLPTPSFGLLAGG